MTQTYLIQTCMSPHHPNPQLKIKHLETHQHQTSPVFSATPKLFEGQKINNLNKNGPHLHLGSTRKNLFRQVLANGRLEKHPVVTSGNHGGQE